MTRPDQQRISGSGQQGITRLEIILVLIIVVILGLVLAEQLGQRLDQARQEVVSSDMQRIASGLHQYKLDNQRYPTTQQGLQALLSAPDTAPRALRWDGPYLSRETLLQDPWGRPYSYQSSDAPPAFSLGTLGADGREGGENGKTDTLLRYQSSGE